MTNREHNLKVLKGPRLNLELAVSSFYALKAVEASEQWKQSDLFLRSREVFKKDFKAYASDFESKLARVMFDYLALASFGEARRAGVEHLRNTVLERDETKYAFPHRMEAYRACPVFNPKKFLPRLQKLFYNPYDWGGGNSEGGKLWGDIASAAQMYFNMPHSVFIDHAVDLSHNGGLCFDKGILVYVVDEYRYVTMLEKKKVEPLYSSGPLDNRTADLIERANNLGYSKFQRSTGGETFKPENADLQWPKPIRWGRRKIQIRARKRKGGEYVEKKAA